MNKLRLGRTGVPFFSMKKKFEFALIIPILSILCLYSCQNSQVPAISTDAQNFYDAKKSVIVDSILNNYFGNTGVPMLSTCKTKILGGDEKSMSVWSICKHPIEGEQMETSISSPVKISFDNNGITALQFPRDGSAYSSDVEKLFPKNVISYYFDDREKVDEIVKELNE